MNIRRDMTEKQISELEGGGQGLSRTQHNRTSFKTEEKVSDVEDRGENKENDKKELIKEIKGNFFEL